MTHFYLLWHPYESISHKRSHTKYSFTEENIVGNGAIGINYNKSDHTVFNAFYILDVKKYIFWSWKKKRLKVLTFKCFIRLFNSRHCSTRTDLERQRYRQTSLVFHFLKLQSQELKSGSKWKVCF